MSNADLIVIGAGAAGLLAAARGAERGLRTLLVEKNRKAGVKILMSGGTRCNLTQNTDARGIIDAFGPPGRFLHSALAALSPADLVALFAAEGVLTKIEVTGKIFPQSDTAVDVQQALLRRLSRSGATLALGESVVGISRHEPGFQIRTSSRTLQAANVLITTGGQSYPGCGTTGDGYAWARELGHTVVAPRPSLVPITTESIWVRELSGLTLPDVGVRVLPADAEATPAQKKTDRRSRGAQAANGRSLARGSFLFTHFGLSGPSVLDVSREVTAFPHPTHAVLECDFLPALSDGDWLDWWKVQAREHGGRGAASLLQELLPERLARALTSEARIASDRRVAELGRQEQERLLTALKRQRVPVSGTRGFPKAEVTAGGVALEEVDSRTLESKRVPGLYFAGEILDLDGPIGGYNFQAAFSTGWLAAERMRV